MLALQDNLGIYITHCRSTMASLYEPTWTLDKSFYYVAVLNNSNSLGAWILSWCQARHIINNTRRATVCNNTELHFWTEASELGQHLKGGGVHLWGTITWLVYSKHLTSKSGDPGKGGTKGTRVTPHKGVGGQEPGKFLKLFTTIWKIHRKFIHGSVFFLTT